MACDHEKFWCHSFHSFNFFSIKTILGFFLIAFISLGFFFSTTLRAQSFGSVNLQEITEFVKKIQSYRQEYTNYRVKFREFTDNNFFIGDLYYTKPDQMRITYYRGKKVVTDVFLGQKKLIIYFVNSSIVYEQENFNTFDTSLRLNPGSLDYLLKAYNFNFKNSKEPVSVFLNDDYRLFNLTRNPQQLAYHLILTPKNVTEGLDNLEIWLLAEYDDKEGHRPTQVIRSRLKSKSGVTSDIYFSEIEINKQLPAGIYNFVIPSHVRIVKNFFPPLEKVNLKSISDE